MELISGIVQHYAWGDSAFIPHLLGVRADDQPWAELWFGTHAGGPATVVGDGPLHALCGDLPYLLKVLAAAEPLSLQTHPDAARAAAGFAREEAASIPVDASYRTYRDPYPKPELICALTSFEALCGFRPVDQTVALLRELGAADLAELVAYTGLPNTVATLYRGSGPVEATLAACVGRAEPEAQLVNTLAKQYPDDPSVVVTLLLNRITLEPGEAIFLGPGNLHAYLHGVGIEIMGASDNVVRGGLTSKHIDIEELLAVLDTTPLLEPRTPASAHGPGNWCYETGDTPFRLWRHEIDDTFTHTATGRELVLCTDGGTDHLARGQAGYLAPGETITLTGEATVFRVEEAALTALEQ